ncbi:MAG: TPM domain-containing protein [Flavobacteriia bacterium]|nr:TPM domain-containing protein [Flavobacteriia bacterium]NBV92370.1 TPM domain-containing protein [Flavobacteriia bacterium]NBY41277.1 TPM domain-containing protein [Flavobacteriia bacterium]
MLSQADKTEIVSAITASETSTSGEIRIHIDSKGSKDPFVEAKKTFEKLGMTKTQERNGVLIYVCFPRKQLTILGDSGIDKKVPEGFWDDTYKIMSEHFSKGDYKTGLLLGIQKAGIELGKFFPFQKNDINELSNEISEE